MPVYFSFNKGFFLCCKLIFILVGYWLVCRRVSYSIGEVAGVIHHDINKSICINPLREVLAFSTMKDVNVLQKLVSETSLSSRDMDWLMQQCDGHLISKKLKKKKKLRLPLAYSVGSDYIKGTRFQTFGGGSTSVFV